MNFLRGYSAVVITLCVILCIFAAEDTYEFIGGLLFAPVAYYLIKSWADDLKTNKKK